MLLAYGVKIGLCSAAAGLDPGIAYAGCGCPVAGGALALAEESYDGFSNRILLAGRSSPLLLLRW